MERLGEKTSKTYHTKTELPKPACFRLSCEFQLPGSLGVLWRPVSLLRPSPLGALGAPAMMNKFSSPREHPVILGLATSEDIHLDTKRP